METEILYYNKFKGIEKPLDYVNWAISMLINEISSTSLNILASLREPLNIFEVEVYFNRAIDELGMKEPSYEQCAKYYVRYLLRQIIDDKNNAMNFAYKIYEVVRESFTNEELEIWYEISEMIDDFRYGDNLKKLTNDFIITIIVQEAKKQLGSKFFLN